ncbi:hypothetical protein PS838_00259 [Pseudomonas fluorescens]|nr:hypothetical protein PS838_00259 [Pseudomonas fluorescens]
MLAKGSRAPLGIWFYALSFTIFASKLAPTGGSQVYLRGFIRAVKRLKPVGASLLAKGSRAPLGIWFYALSFTIFASKLAPTGFAGLLARFNACGRLGHQRIIGPIVTSITYPHIR